MVRKAISEAITTTVDFLVDHGVDSDIAMDSVMGLFKEIDGAMVNFQQIKDDYFSYPE